MAQLNSLGKHDPERAIRRFEGRNLSAGDTVEVDVRASAIHDRFVDELAGFLPEGISLKPKYGEDKEPTVTDPDMNVPISTQDLIGVKKRRDDLPPELHGERLFVRPGDRYRTVYEGTGDTLAGNLSKSERWKRLQVLGAITPLVDHGEFNKGYQDLDIELSERLHRILHSPDASVQLPRGFIDLLKRHPEVVGRLGKDGGPISPTTFYLPVSDDFGFLKTASMFRRAASMFQHGSIPYDIKDGIPFFARLHVRKEGGTYRPKQAPISAYGLMDGVNKPTFGRRRLGFRVLNENQEFDSVDMRFSIESPQDLIDAGLITKEELEMCHPDDNSGHIKTYLEFMLFPPDVI